MPTAEARNRTLGQWLNRVNTRQIVLPRFQRFEAWGPKEISDLLLTVVRGLPVGSVLVLEIGDELPFVWRVLEGASEDGERISELLLDGQQRLTALWRSLNDNYEDKTYLLEFDGDESPQIVYESRWIKNGKRYPLWVDNPKEVWEKGYIPVSLLKPGDDARKTLGNWADEASGQDSELARKIERTAGDFRDRFKEFNLPFLSLPVGTDKSTVIDVFVKMNTRIVRLKAFDIIVAQVEQETGESLHDRVQDIEREFPEITKYIDPSDLVLTASALLLDRAPNRSGYLGIDDFGKVINNWDKLKQGIKETIRFLHEERVIDGKVLPTISVLAPLVALWAEIPDQPNSKGNANIVLRKYLWSAFFTTRYEKAAASAALQDYRALRKVLNNEATKDDVPIFDKHIYSLPEVEEILQAGWPTKRDRLSRAILLVTLYGGAKDILEGSKVDNLDEYEYHHVYPVAYLKDKGDFERKTYLALNCALIKWRTNRKIGAKDPLQYLLDASNASTAGVGESEICERLKSHALNYNDVSEGDYNSFFGNRALIIIDAAKTLTDGKSWQY